VKSGKKACSRDGHSACLYHNKLIIFGGDRLVLYIIEKKSINFFILNKKRHKMSFNDVYMLDLEMVVNHPSVKN
jgi:hypothetical protein